MAAASHLIHSPRGICRHHVPQHPSMHQSQARLETEVAGVLDILACRGGFLFYFANLVTLHLTIDR